MKKENISVFGVEAPDPRFNHVVKAGNFLFLTSQLSADLKTGKFISGNIQVQTRQTLENIRFILESSGSGLDKIVKITIYMRDVGEFDQMNEVYGEFFISGQDPARVVVQAPSPMANVDVLIEVTALTER